QQNSTPLEKARNRLRLCGFSDKEVKNLHVYLSEWYESNSLEDAVEKWETYGIKQNVVPNIQNVLLSFCLFNVQGWKSRALEVLHLIQKAEASLAICTEVGAYWDSFKLPNFNMFYQEGTNHCGGVTIAVGKHPKATKIDSNLENTIVVDISGLSEPIRVIGIYWPESQKTNLKDLDSFICKNTIISGDFNAAIVEWGSPKIDCRGKILKKWVDSRNLQFVPGTFNSSKRSLRNIDLTFTNFPGVEGVTLEFGTSDHWPIFSAPMCDPNNLDDIKIQAEFNEIMTNLSVCATSVKPTSAAEL
ncbi:unnamed protein product, partial [Didymodactylos carnosus]